MLYSEKKTPMWCMNGVNLNRNLLIFFNKHKNDLWSTAHYKHCTNYRSIIEFHIIHDFCIHEKTYYLPIKVTSLLCFNKHDKFYIIGISTLIMIVWRLLKENSLLLFLSFHFLKKSIWRSQMHTALEIKFTFLDNVLS